MGFFSKLKKVVAGVDKGAAIAAGVLPCEAGQVAGEVAGGGGRDPDATRKPLTANKKLAHGRASRRAPARIKVEPGLHP